MRIFCTKLLMVFLCLAALTSCWKVDLKENFGREGMMTPRPHRMGQMPQGDDPYSQGVRDGCNTAIGVLGTGPITTMYDDIYYDFDKTVNDSDYYKGRTLGFNYCSYYQDPDPF